MHPKCLTGYLYFAPNSVNVLWSAHFKVVIGVLVLLHFGRRSIERIAELRVEIVQESVQALEWCCAMGYLRIH